MTFINSAGFPLVFLWFSSGFPLVFLWFSSGLKLYFYESHLHIYFIYIYYIYIFIANILLLHWGNVVVILIIAFSLWKNYLKIMTMMLHFTLVWNCYFPIAFPRMNDVVYCRFHRFCEENPYLIRNHWRWLSRADASGSLASTECMP